MRGLFGDRRAAGRYLAAMLADHAHEPGLIVLGLPRGGVPVAFEVAEALDVPLDVFTVRKLGVPHHEELAMGAIAAGGVRVLNDDVVRELGIATADIEAVERAERAELARRELAYRGDRPPPRLAGRTVLLVDDGIATGATARAAVAALRAARVARVIVAAPVASREACALVRAVADGCIVAVVPPYFMSVGAWYADFGQTTDDEVRDLLALRGARGGSEHGRLVTS
ncbi:MAG: phosphoribosyltransferase [Gemmatimonadetes bacterium]|nr:phosphoribosyltransferase [Gemmatimonadota bacterium]